MTPHESDRPLVLVLVAHPRPGSLNHALTERIVAELAQRGLPLKVHDLYAEEFDPVLRPEEAYTSGDDAEQVGTAIHDPLVVRHRKELAEASALVVVHPNWWGKPPAILAGWMDRVLVPGVAYRLSSAGGAPTSMLSLKQVLVVNTSDTSEEREIALFGDPLEDIWVRCLAPYLGDPQVRRVVFRVVADADEGQRARWFEQVADEAGRLLPSEGE